MNCPPNNDLCFYINFYTWYSYHIKNYSRFIFITRLWSESSNLCQGQNPNQKWVESWIHISGCLFWIPCWMASVILSVSWKSTVSEMLIVQSWNAVFFRWTWFWSPRKVFLQFLYLWKVLIENPDDAKLAPLGKLSNMQITAAITKISFLGHFYYTR